MKCVLIRPQYRTNGYDERSQECLGIGYVGAILRQEGHDVVVVDADMERLDDETTVRRAAAACPDLIGLSVMSEDALDSTGRLVPMLRKSCSSAHIVIGGHLPSFAPEWILRLCPELDSLIRFEGEPVLRELAECLETGRDWKTVCGLCWTEDGEFHATDLALPIDDLDTIPFPIRDTLPLALERGLVPAIASSRGCQGKCTFCAVHQFNQDENRPWRFRTPRNIVDEIEQLVIDHGIREVNFVDDDFIGNRRQGQPRARELAAELKRRNLDVIFSIQCRAQLIDSETFRALREAGLRMVFFGIEATDHSTQKVFKKASSPESVGEFWFW